MSVPIRTGVFLAALLVLATFVGPTSALKRKNRAFPSQKSSLFSPLIMLDDEDRRELGKAGSEYATQNIITQRNPILLVPGT